MLFSYKTYVLYTADGFRNKQQTNKRGKWFAAKVLQENSDVKTNSGSISLPCIPSNGWRVFPSQNIPSLFNYGHVHYYASFKKVTGLAQILLVSKSILA